MWTNNMLFYKYLLLVNVFVTIESLQPRSVNVALDTVFKFDPNDFPKDLKIIAKVEKFLDKVKKAIRKEPMSRRVLHTDVKFLDFLENLVLILRKLPDDDLKHFFGALDEEIRRYHYKGCKFYELARNSDDLRNYVSEKLEQYRNADPQVLRRSLTDILKTLRRKNFNKQQTQLITLIDSLYTRKSSQSMVKFLNNLHPKSSKYRRKEKDLKMILRDGIRSLIFDQYSELNRHARRELKVKVEAFWKDLGSNKTDSLIWELNAKRKPTTDKTENDRKVEIDKFVDDNSQVVSKEKSSLRLGLPEKGTAVEKSAERNEDDNVNVKPTAVSSVEEATTKATEHFNNESKIYGLAELKSFDTDAKPKRNTKKVKLLKNTIPILESVESVENVNKRKLKQLDDNEVTTEIIKKEKKINKYRTTIASVNKNIYEPSLTTYPEKDEREGDKRIYLPTVPIIESIEQDSYVDTTPKERPKVVVPKKKSLRDKKKSRLISESDQSSDGTSSNSYDDKGILIDFASDAKTQPKKLENKNKYIKIKTKQNKKPVKKKEILISRFLSDDEISSGYKTTKSESQYVMNNKITKRFKIMKNYKNKKRRRENQKKLKIHSNSPSFRGEDQHMKNILTIHNAVINIEGDFFKDDYRRRNASRRLRNIKFSSIDVESVETSVATERVSYRKRFIDIPVDINYNSSEEVTTKSTNTPSTTTDYGKDCIQKNNTIKKTDRAPNEKQTELDNVKIEENILNKGNKETQPMYRSKTGKNEISNFHKVNVPPFETDSISHLNINKYPTENVSPSDIDRISEQHESVPDADSYTRQYTQVSNENRIFERHASQSDSMRHSDLYGSPSDINRLPVHRAVPSDIDRSPDQHALPSDVDRLPVQRARPSEPHKTAPNVVEIPEMYSAAPDTSRLPRIQAPQFESFPIGNLPELNSNRFGLDNLHPLDDKFNIGAADLTAGNMPYGNLPIFDRAKRLPPLENDKIKAQINIAERLNKITDMPLKIGNNKEDYVKFQNQVDDILSKYGPLTDNYFLKTSSSETTVKFDNTESSSIDKVSQSTDKKTTHTMETTREIRKTKSTTAKEDNEKHTHVSHNIKVDEEHTTKTYKGLFYKSHDANFKDESQTNVKNETEFEIPIKITEKSTTQEITTTKTEKEINFKTEQTVNPKDVTKLMAPSAEMAADLLNIPTKRDDNPLSHVIRFNNPPSNMENELVTQKKLHPEFEQFMTHPDLDERQLSILKKQYERDMAKVFQPLTSDVPTQPRRDTTTPADPFADVDNLALGLDPELK